MHFRKILFFVIILLYCINTNKVFAQADYTIVGSNKDTSIKSIAVLADKNYTLQQILTDTSLHFLKQEKISIKGLTHYWARFSIKNSSTYDAKFAVWASPAFDNLLYAFNEDSAKWNATRSGHNVNNNTTIFKYAPILCKGNAETVFYTKIDVTAFKMSNNILSTELSLKKLSNIEERAKQNYAWWLVTLFVVFAFFIYNAYLYLMFKDRVYLYYLLALLSGIVYISGISFNLPYLTNCKLLAATLHPTGDFNYLPTDIAVGNISAAFVLLGLAQFARHYLQMAVYIPFWNKLLKYSIAVFVTYQLGYVLLQLFGGMSLADIFPLISNFFILYIIAIMLLAGSAAHRKKVKQAKYYLQAQILPLAAIIFLVLYLFTNKENQSLALRLLPNIAIVLQTLTFAIALVARVNLLKNDLHSKTIQHQQVTGQMAIEQEHNTRLEEKIEFDKRDIAAAKQIKLLMKELHHRVKNNLQIVSSLLSLQSFRITDKIAANAVREGQHRIEAMSMIHQRLYTHDNITEVNIKEYITDLSESLMLAYGYSRDNFVLKLHIENEMMNVDKAIPLSLIINELVTNAFKYAFSSIEKPTLTITLSKAKSDIQLFIADNGKGIDMQAWQTNKGYGKELVQTFTKQLDGEMSVEVDNGTTFKISFPNYLLDIN